MLRKTRYLVRLVWKKCPVSRAHAFYKHNKSFIAAVTSSWKFTTLKILIITRPFQPMPVLLLRQKTLTLKRISLTIWHTANVLRSLERPLRTVLSICTLLSLSTASLVFQSSIGKSFRNWHTNVYLSLGSFEFPIASDHTIWQYDVLGEVFSCLPLL